MRTILLSFMLIMFSINFSVAQDEVQRVRLDFQNSEGYTRQLLLGFTPDDAATDGTDYGYDALNPDNLPDDLNWIIEDQRYIIQGVGAFSEDKYYPLGMFLTNSGDVSISLNGLENFEEDIDVYIYDLELDIYTLLNDVNYISNLSAETYLNRFYITFSDVIGDTISNEVLAVFQTEFEDLKIWHSTLQNELNINGLSKFNGSITIMLYSIDGKRIIDKKVSENNNSYTIKLPTIGISAGVYILIIESDVYSYTTKVYIDN